MKQETNRGRHRGQLIAEYFSKNPNARLTHDQVESRFGKLNNAYKNVERWAAHFLPGVSRADDGSWSFKAPTAPTAKRGQGGTCTGKLVISLRGPKGSGKSMVAAVLKPLLPLLPLDQFEVREEMD